MSPAVAKPARGGRRRRWLLRVAILLLVLAGASALVLRQALEPERLSGLLLGRASAATGLELRLDRPAGIGWWPELHVELSGLEARLPASSELLLRVEEVDLVLPWSGIDQDMPEIRRLRLVEPRLRIDLVEAALAAMPAPDGPPGPLRLPEFSGEIDVERGVLLSSAEAEVVRELDLSLPRLAVGQAMALDLAAAIVREPAAPLEIELAARAAPVETDAGLGLEALSFALDFPGAPARIAMQGSARVEPPALLQLDARGQLDQWPASWPPLPLPSPSPNSGDAAIELDVAWTARGDAGAVDFSLAREGLRAEGAFSVPAVLDWLGRDDASPLPPIRLTAQAPRVEQDGVVVEGLQVELTPDEAEP